MSFGFGIGDFFVVLEQANRVWKGFSTAPAQYQAITTEVKTFSVLIKDARTHLPGRTLTEVQRQDLTEIISGCRQTLLEAETLLSKCSSLKSSSCVAGTKQSTKRIWHRIKLDSDDVRDFRSRLTINIGLLSAYADSLQRETLSELVCRNDDLQQTILTRQCFQEQQEILDWLAPADYAAQHSNHVAHRLNDTGQWLLESSEYISWSGKDDKNNGLYLFGIPGGGKTILSSIVIDELQAKHNPANDVGVCYYYCDYKRQSDQSLEQILLRLLRQLANSVGLAIIKDLYTKHTTLGTRPLLPAIRSTLHAIMKCLSSTFVIVDALDECQSIGGCQEALLAELLELNKLADTSVKVMITSRQSHDFTSHFKDFKSIEVLAKDQDIRKYISTHIQQLPKFVANQIDLQEEIKTAIINAVGGMFLLATLHFRALHGKRSIKHLKLTLASLSSSSYPDAYTTTMNRICSQVEDQKDLAIDSLTWIVYAQRSLTSPELLHALAVEIESTELDEDNIPDVQDILTACCGLVIIEPETQFVRLVHQTTQDFLKDYGSTWLPKGHTKLSKICNTYLAFEALAPPGNDTKTGFQDLVASYPLYDYASWHWIDHAQMRNDLSVEELVTSQKQIDNSSEALMTNTAPEYLNLRRKYPDLTGLHLLAFCGLTSMMPKFLERYDVNEVDGSGHTPILYAIQKNQMEAMSILIKNGARLDDRYEYLGRQSKLSPDKSGDTLQLPTIDDNRYTLTPPFMRAASKLDASAVNLGQTLLCTQVAQNNIDMVQLLLDYGVDVNGRDYHRRTPIYCACQYGRLEIARLLLKRGADLTIKENSGRTPLYAAVRHGRLEIVKLLLEEDLDVNETNERGETTLCVAARKHNFGIVELLLDRGADINQLDRHGKTPLNYASQAGYAEVVRLLLDRGADINQADDQGRTPLYAASGSGSIKVVKLLLDRGADVNKANDKGETPLYAGSGLYISIGVPRLLLDRGADPNIETKVGRTPLFSAALNGRIQVLRLLHQRGASFMTDGGVQLRGDSHGRSIYQYAAKSGDLDTLTYLLENGPLPLSEDKFGRNLLDYATISGSSEMINMVLKFYQTNKLQLNSSSTWSTLHWACREGSYSDLKPLIEAGIKHQLVETKMPAAYWSPFDLAVSVFPAVV